MLLAIVVSVPPNYLGDFCNLLKFGTCRVAIRREEGARRPTGSRSGSAQRRDPEEDDAPPAESL